MKDWIVRSLPPRTSLRSYHGVRPGDVVNVIGWTGDRSVDTRKVVGLFTERCDGGVMVVIDQLLRNQRADSPVPGYGWGSIRWLEGHR